MSRLRYCTHCYLFSTPRLKYFTQHWVAGNIFVKHLTLTACSVKFYNQLIHTVILSAFQLLGIFSLCLFEPFFPAD